MPDEISQNKKNIADDEKLWAGLSYLFWPLAIILVYFTDKKKSHYLRHHGFQAIFFGLAVFATFAVYIFLVRILLLSLGNKIASIAFAAISAITSISFLLFVLLIFILVILYTYRAMQGSYFKIPFIYNFSKKFIQES